MEFNPIFHDIQQNSEEWDQMKLGLFSSSMVSDLFMKKDTKGYGNAICNVAFERVTGKSQRIFTLPWFNYGHETEPEANENYQTETFNELSNGGI